MGASGKLGRYLVQHALDRGYEVVAVCREVSVDKLEEFSGRITVIPGATNDRQVIQRAVAGCDAVLTVLVPRGVHQYSSGTAQAVLDHARPAARLVFSCGYHITRDGQDVYSWKVKALVGVAGRLARLVRLVDLDDQVEACRRVFASDTRWTVVRGSDLEEGEPEGLPVWSEHVGDPILRSNITRRVDFARFMVEAIENDDLVHVAPAIVGCRTPSALAHATDAHSNESAVLLQKSPEPIRSRSSGDHVTATFTLGRSLMFIATTPSASAQTKQRSRSSTTTYRRTAVFVGLLFLTATAAFTVAEVLNSGVLSQPNFLTVASSEAGALGTGALLLFGQFGVVGIAVLLFPC